MPHRMSTRIGIAGAGFAGAVLAQELAKSGKYSIEVFDERPHVAGNCHTSRDPASGIMLHHYGPHIFNTSRQDVWDYVNRYATFGAYTNRVKAITARGVFSMPMNLLTINQFFGKVMNPSEARAFLATVGDASIKDPQNFEEQALRFLGRELYENFFYGYTKKQWGVEPTELPAAILQRLPVRFNYDDNYYQQRYQGIPVEGYTAIVEKLLDHPAIEVKVGQRLQPSDAGQFDHVLWSGPLDAYFEHELGRLQYRSLVFERFDATGDYQGNPVLNYCEESVSWTRISEHKHFAPWEEHQKTVCFREYSKLAEGGDIPYYPMRLEGDKSMLRQYMNAAQKTTGVSFVGRLGTYRYLDMHVVIGESLDFAKTVVGMPTRDWPKFSAPPLN
jgi:UDP-galactopyranose mutase